MFRRWEQFPPFDPAINDNHVLMNIIDSTARKGTLYANKLASGKQTQLDLGIPRKMAMSSIGEDVYSV